MKIFPVVQNTPQWLQARCGVVTASAFSKILTPAKGDLSKQMGGYENRIVAERITGDPIDDFGGNVWTERGHELEPEAVAMYEMLREADVTHAGFISNDAETVGCSPDGLVNDDGLLEIKCLAPHTIIGVLLDGESDDGHYPQLQGQLFVTGRKWVDILYYHPKLPPLIQRVNRDEEYIRKLSIALAQMELNIQEKISKIGKPVAPRKMLPVNDDIKKPDVDVRMGG